MKPYRKIVTVWERDPDNKYKTLIGGKYATEEFEYLADDEWVFTEKVDGTNIRVIFDGEQHVSFAGRTDKAEIPAFLLANLQKMFAPAILAEYFQDKISFPLCLYGEGYGNRIQKVGSKYNPDNTSFILFDIFTNNLWLSRRSCEQIAIGLDIDIVPVVGTGCLSYAVDMARKGFQSTLGEDGFIAEGLIMKPAIELRTRRGYRIITKIKYKDFSRD